MVVRAAKLIMLWSLMTILGSAAAADLCPTQPIKVKLSRASATRVIAKEKVYTQGLIYSNGQLYESVGLERQSELRRIDPYTGNRTTIANLNPAYFAEGLTEINGKMIQLTYKQNVALIYRDEDLEQTVAYPGESWGLTQLNGELVKSDGSERLYFVDLRTLNSTRFIVVHDNARTYKRLNELENVRGMILANIFGKDWVAMINPINGCVIGKIDLSEIRRDATRDPREARCFRKRCVPEDFATNGIAYDENRDDIYFTGKNWQYIYRFQFSQIRQSRN